MGSSWEAPYAGIKPLIMPIKTDTVKPKIILERVSVISISIKLPEISVSK